MVDARERVKVFYRFEDGDIGETDWIAPEKVISLVTRWKKHKDKKPRPIYQVRCKERFRR